MGNTDLQQLGNFKVLTFDCYGTLIDWEAGIWDGFQPLITGNGRSDVLRKDALEAFAIFESRLEEENPGMPYPEILARVHGSVATLFKLQTTPELDTGFGETLPHWPAFPDTADALRYLKTRYKLAILSNVNRDGISASQRKLGVEFDAVYTAEDIGSYKPAASNFEYMLEHLHRDHGLEKKDILHTAQSLFHDHVPARSFDLATAWIDRQGLSKSGVWGATSRLNEIPATDFLFHSMGEMAAAVAAAGKPL
jgi:2-haloalkanoic acid dehalogenase type II